MRIPDGYLTCPVFLGGRDSRDTLHYRATAFFISTPSKLARHGGISLVTARHNIRGALEDYGNVWVRLNMEDGSAEDIEITAPWAFPENPASDVAAVPFWPPVNWEGAPLPVDWFATDEIIQTQGVGIGEELFVVGLFRHHVGTRRNLPIVRSGSIASMPLEPFIDDDSGEEYDAYLAEVRSIGGLSGSPVIVALNPSTRLHRLGPEREKEDPKGLVFYVLGLIRCHWEQPVEKAFGTEVDSLNTGIAVVTPITEVLPLLEREEFVRQRKKIDEILARGRGRETKDMAPEAPSTEFESFEDLARKLVAVPKEEIDKKRKDES